eukprot:6172119-Alexandrium_andersonii.AAC.1
MQPVHGRSGSIFVRLSEPAGNHDVPRHRLDGRHEGADHLFTLAGGSAHQRRAIPEQQTQRATLIQGRAGLPGIRPRPHH